jgi:hypothetical protein
MKTSSKISEWIKRYAPAEAVSFLFTLLAAGITFNFSKNHVASALAGTWGGNAGFFGYILASDIIQSRKECRKKGMPFQLKEVGLIIRGLILEFGFAEIADSFFVRPFLMYYLPLVFSNFSLGIILAKFAADITFYIPAIFFYESNKRIVKRKHKS